MKILASIPQHLLLMSSISLLTLCSACTFPIDAALYGEDGTDGTPDPSATPDPDDSTPGITTPFTGTPIVSDFSQDEDGWLTFDTGPISWEASGGKSGAYATAVTSGYDFWVAPEKFVGILTDAYGHTLRFSRRVEVTGDSNRPDVTLISSTGQRLYHTFSNQPTGSWAAYQVTFHETEWENEDGDAPTSSELKAVLADLSQLLINTGSYYYPEGSCDLDEVSLEAERTEPTLPDGIQATFDADTEDWITVEQRDVAWESEPGSHGGYVTQYSDADQWVAPAQFTGDLSSAYGQTLTFERRVESPGDDYRTDVTLVAASGLTLEYQFPFTSSPGWTRFSVVLKENGWTNAEDDKPVITSEMKEALGDLSQLLISVDGYYYGDAAHDLDNVAIGLGE